MPPQILLDQTQQRPPLKHECCCINQERIGYTQLSPPVPYFLVDKEVVCCRNGDGEDVATKTRSENGIELFASFHQGSFIDEDSDVLEDADIAARSSLERLFGGLCLSKLILLSDRPSIQEVPVLKNTYSVVGYILHTHTCTIDLCTACRHSLIHRGFLS